jgi:hypothetical protein
MEKYVKERSVHPSPDINTSSLNDILKDATLVLQIVTESN